MVPPLEPKKEPWTLRAKNAVLVFRQVPPSFRLLFAASPWGLAGLLALTLLLAVLPAALAYVGKLIVDAVVHAASTRAPAAEAQVWSWVLVELGLMAASMVLSRLRVLLREIVGAVLAQRLSVRILEKALSLELAHFEDSEVHDKMQRARREASSRPLSLVLESFSIGQNVITLATYGALVIALSPWLLFLLFGAAIPSFVSELRFAGKSFRLHSWRAPEGRRLNYLEYVLTRDGTVKEVKLFGLGELFLSRFRGLYRKFFAEDTRLAVQRAAYGLLLGLLSLGAFYACYAWVAGRAGAAQITLGDMTLYLVVFRQGQAAFSSILSSVGSMYEDALFMSNLFAFFALPVRSGPVATRPVPAGRGHALVLEGVSFRYPGKGAWALQGVSVEIAPREKIGLVGENGAGKTTLVKLIMRLYEPVEGRITYGGVDIREFDEEEWRRHIGAVFQDAVRYQLTLAENIGVGDVARLEDRARIAVAAEQGGADAVAAELPQGYDTMLGGWFEKGQELSGGQWQKVAVARAFMREAPLLILDEPAASIDAEAEAQLFERMKALAADKIALVISHRFSTMRIADRVLVLHKGRVVEVGSHAELMARGGRYASLFELQAKGYQ